MRHLRPVLVAAVAVAASLLGTLLALVILLHGAGAHPPDVVERVSLSTAGAQQNGDNGSVFGGVTGLTMPVISDSGRFVAFQSPASNLVGGDTNVCLPYVPSCTDVFLRDRDTDADGIMDEVGAVGTTRVSITGGIQGDGASFVHDISGTGRYVAFHSFATNLGLIPPDTNLFADVFVRDTCFGAGGGCLPATTRISLSTAGAEGDADSYNPSISDDGRFVTFFSGSTTLVAGDTNGTTDVFLRDRDLDADGIFDEPGPGEVSTTRVSVSTGFVGTEGDGPSVMSDLSATGRYVTFESSATNLVPGDTNGAGDAFVRDTCFGAAPGCIPSTTRVSESSAGAEANAPTFVHTISGDGRFVSFMSYASNLVAGDTNTCPGDLGFIGSCPDAFVRDRDTDADGIWDEPGAVATVRVSVSTAGAQANGVSDNNTFVSDNGRYVAFNSEASNLVAVDSNLVFDAFVRDRDTDSDGVFDEPGAVQTFRASESTTGLQGNGASVTHGMTGDGRFVVMDSAASTLVAGDTNFLCDHNADSVFVENCNDVFVHDLVAPAAGLQEAIFSVTVPGIVVPGCEPAQLLVLPGVTGVPCPRAPLAPDDLPAAPPGVLGLDMIAGAGSDDLDAYSMSEPLGTGTPEIHFSVDTVAVGLPGCPAPDVASQAAAGEAPGDIFTDLAPPGCNTLFQDEAVQGLIAPGAPLDDMDALAEPVAGGTCIDPVTGGPSPCPVYSISAASAINGALDPWGAPILPGSVLVAPGTPVIPGSLPFGCPGGGLPCVAVFPPVLGLDGAGPGADDLDGLCWFDLNSNGLPEFPLFAGGPDNYWFSVSSASALVGADILSPGDILAPAGGVPAVVTAAAAIGLVPNPAGAPTGDDLDAMKCLRIFGGSDADGDGIPDASDTEGPSPNANGVAGGDDCIDGVDNDGDGLTDLAETACDGDADGVWDLSDNCPTVPNPGQSNVDADGFGDACDTEGPSPNSNGLGGADDCTDAVDNDGDGMTDGADATCDADGDGVPDAIDNCPTVSNPPQTNTDTDVYGDACDSDDDDDGYVDTDETLKASAPLVNAETPEHCNGIDEDGDTVVDDEPPGGGYSWDTDGDTVKDCADASIDTDGDTVANPTDTDDDGDGYSDTVEVFVSTDPLDKCPDNSSDDAHPLDQDRNGSFNVSDILKYKGKTPASGMSTPKSALYSRRLDIDGNGSQNVSDILKYKGKTPSACT